jgi:hypothetical protein
LNKYLNAFIPGPQTAWNACMAAPFDYVDNKLITVTGLTARHFQAMARVI